MWLPIRPSPSAKATVSSAAPRSRGRHPYDRSPVERLAALGSVRSRCPFPPPVHCGVGRLKMTSRCAAVLALVLIASCGGSDERTLTAPSERPAVQPAPEPPPPAPAPPPEPSPQPAPPPAAEEYSLSGTLRDPSGLPVPGASVTAVASKTYSRSATSDQAGMYRLRARRGTYSLWVTKPGYRTIEHQSFSLASDLVVDITLSPGVRLGGIVSEAGVGPLSGVTVEILSGPSSARPATSGPPGVTGAFTFGYVLPGTYRLRASKEAYEPAEISVDAQIGTHVTFALKWAYANCLQSVTPTTFSSYSSQGGTETVGVAASPGAEWRIASFFPWLEVTSPATHVGSSVLQFRVLPYPPGATEPRLGALEIRCPGGGGQNIWVTQNPDCRVRLELAAVSPAVVPAEGGSVRLHVRPAVAGCGWHSRSETRWIRPVGPTTSRGDADVAFVVDSNPTQRERTGIVVVGETRWTVTQR